MRIAGDRWSAPPRQRTTCPLETPGKNQPKILCSRKFFDGWGRFRRALCEKNGGVRWVPPLASPYRGTGEGTGALEGKKNRDLSRHVRALQVVASKLCFPVADWVSNCQGDFWSFVGHWPVWGVSETLFPLLRFLPGDKEISCGAYRRLGSISKASGFSGQCF